MDVGKAITFFRDDEQWVGKIIIAAVFAFLSFLLVPIPLVIGYSIGIGRNVMNHLEKPLPEWTNFGKLFMDGLYVLIAQIVYTLPFWIIACIGFAATVGFGSLSEMSEEAAASGILATFGVTGCLALIFALALVVISPAIFIQYLRTEDFGAMFRFREVFQIVQANVGDILVTVAVSIAAGVVLSLLTGVLSIIPCLGWIAGVIISLLFTPWLSFALGHLYGQIAAKGAALKAEAM
jgi:hypothetical protein